MNRLRMLIAGGLALFCLLGPVAPPAQAEPIYALTQVGGQGTPISFDLLSFDSATPNLINTQVSITGISIFERLRDIDFRPSKGQLYSLGTAGAIYTLTITHIY